MTITWKKQRERGSTRALHLILWIALNLGWSSARLLLYPTTFYFLLTGAAQRKASKQYLALALNKKPRLSDVAKHIHTFSATILDRVFLLAENKDYFDVNYHHPELVLDMVQQGRGYILLASVLKVPVILFFGLYRGDNRYDIHFELFTDQVTIERNNRSADLQLWTQRYANRLEHYARLAPYNWFNFYDFWNEDEN